MPAVPLGGLSFFLNLGIVLVGASMKYLRKNGYDAQFFLFPAAVLSGKQFDHTWRRFMGYTLMVGISSYLFLSAGISFVERMGAETNVDLMNEEMNDRYPITYQAELSQ